MIGPVSARGVRLDADGGGGAEEKPNKARKLVTVDCQSSRQVMRLFVWPALSPEKSPRGSPGSSQKYQQSPLAHRTHSGSIGA